MLPSKLRLHKLVSNHLKSQKNWDYTNPEIQRNIEKYGVYVDGRLITNRLEWVFFTPKIEFPNWPVRQHGDFSQVQILQHTPDFLLIFKPPGVVVEPGAGHQAHNLITWLQDKQQTELFLVHRLDKDTQGLLLLAKNQVTLDYFQDQFRERKVVKKYLALVNNLVEHIYHAEVWQSRDKTFVVRQKLFWTEAEALEYDANSRQAKTIIRPLVYNPKLNQSLIEVEIHTGRTHQIRLLCEALGYPLVSDSIYDKPTLHTPPTTNLHIQKVFKEPKYTDDLYFQSLIQNTFLPSASFLLLSNYLKIKTPNDVWLEAEYKQSITSSLTIS